MNDSAQRVGDFCQQFGLKSAVLLAPMAGACPPALSMAIADAGGLGACGALMLKPDEIAQWATEFRAGSSGVFQMNLWIPDNAPARNTRHEEEVCQFLSSWGPEVEPDAAKLAVPLDFKAQCEALLLARPNIVSSIMGLYPQEYVDKLKSLGISWFATATTVSEAIAAEAAGADAIVAQGMEAGGHRGCFEHAIAESQQVGLFALLPAVVDAVSIPVIATGAIADHRGVAAAIELGASAAQIGTGFLRCPEAGIASAWADSLAMATPEKTRLTRAFSGRAGRSLATEYVLAAATSSAPQPAPYPLQRGLTTAMRKKASRNNDIRGMQAWAGQSAALSQALPAQQVFANLCKGLP